MDARTAASRYYEAWGMRAGDMTGVPIAEDFTFTGPVTSTDGAGDFLAMASRAGSVVRGLTVRQQFTDGDLVCSIVDWRMARLTGVLTAAEVLEVRDGVIVRGELICDPARLRAAMAPAPIDELLERAVRDTADLVDLVDRAGPAGWDAPSPCAGWTVRQTAEHLVTGLATLTGVVENGQAEQAGAEYAGAHPADALRAIGKRAVAAFAVPETLERRYAYPAPDMPGAAIANICLLETLVHGWDMAAGTGVAYRPADEVVAAVQEYTTATIGDAARARGLFGAAVVTSPGAGPLAATLGHLGRRVS